VKQLGDDDILLAAAFVDGDLPEPQRARFELRLAAEPDLAEHVEHLLQTDELVRRHTRREGADRRRSRLRLLPTLAVAAAAIAAIFAVRAFLVDERLSARSIDVALVPSFESALEWIARDPALAGQLPPGLDELRGANDPPNVDAHTFHEAVSRSESRAFGAATPAETTAAFFSLTARAPVASTVLVFGFPKEGAPLRYWPAIDDADASRIAAGDHVLPGASFRLVDDPRGARIEYQRGFLVPIGAERVDVVIASRPAVAAVDAALLEPASDVGTEVDRLRAAGFATVVFIVDEP